MAELSILIPARNEPYLQKTIDDIFEHSEADTEVLVGLDGWDGDVYALPKPHGERLIFDGSYQSIGQRAMTNRLAKASKAKFLMKVDAHCSFSQGFDKVMLEAMDSKTIMAPYLLILDAEKWDIKPKPVSSAYCFDSDFVFQYNREAENLEPINETMCLQGSAWMVDRQTYWDWKLCDEKLGSWGSQGVELGIKAFLNGGRCVTNKAAYYGHLFRETDTDFPYERDKPQMRHAHSEMKRLYANQSIAPLIEKFNYPADWTVEKVKALPTD